MCIKFIQHVLGFSTFEVRVKVRWGSIMDIHMNSKPEQNPILSIRNALLKDEQTHGQHNAYPLIGLAA